VVCYRKIILICGHRNNQEDYHYFGTAANSQWKLSTKILYRKNVAGQTDDPTD
jgi:hypothetical protein